MIPFAAPKDGCLLNLNAIVQITDTTPAGLTDPSDKRIEVLTTGGKTLAFSGVAANIILAEAVFWFSQYQAMLAAAAKGGQRIVTPDRVM